MSRSGITSLGTASIIPAHFAYRDLPASQESGRIAVDWVFPAQDLPQAAFSRWEFGIPCFSKPIPSWIQAPFPSEGRAGLLVECGEYPGWMKVVLEHPVDVVLLHLAGCGLRNLEPSPGLSTGSGKPWRKIQVLFSFEEQEGKQLPDPSCLLPRRARAGIHQVFPAINISCCFAGAQRQPRLEN